MVYKNFKDLKISALGFGAMRLPTVDGNDSNIDKEKTKEMVALAMKNGVNYYDTAWGYHSGNSELVMGEILSQYDRNKFYLATKFPGYDLSSFGKEDEIFKKQLEKCRTSYFDFYLLHNICEMNIDAYMAREKWHTFDYFMEQKKLGKIKHLGFSAHGSIEVMKRFLDAYGKDMEFCQIQLNYIDWEFQNAKEKVELLKQWNIPVWVMEPVRGGSLARLSSDDVAKLAAARPDESAVAWAFRFIQSVPEAVVTLSGMSNKEQTEQNIKTFETDKPLNSSECELILSIAKKMTTKTTVPCTACHYCTSHCPKHIDIPTILSLYNEHSFTGGGFIAPMALSAIEDGKKPADCIACRSCEKVCPQQIKISEVMSDFVKKLGA